MIESQLDPLKDGTGGGYGKYPGLTVAQIADRFRFLVEEGEGRSARAILRIVHEQTDARGGLGSQRILVALAASVTAALLVCRAFVSEDAQRKLNIYLFGAIGMTVLFGVGAASVHRATVRGETQVREIRRLALMALDALAARPGFVARSLEREHVASLNSLKKVDRATWERVAKSLSV